jgi:hypothetical protein
MKRMIIFAALAVCGCGSSGPSPLQEYETALHVWQMERSYAIDIERALSSSVVDDGEGEPSSKTRELREKLATAEKRLERTLKFVKAAEKKLDAATPKDE